MTKKCVLLTLASLVSLVLCGIAEFYLLTSPDGSIFARSGALVVVLGTLINFVDFGKINTKEYLSEENQNNILRNINSGNGMAAFVIHWKSEQDLRDRIIVFQGYVLILGTLIWGFGDLLFCLVLRMLVNIC
jgi:hypothetical protein